MYELIIDEEVIKFLSKLPKEVSKRIFKKLQETKQDPHRFFIRLVDMTEYKLRIGDYRVIADIDDSKIIIYVLKAGHRKNIYKS